MLAVLWVTVGGELFPALAIVVDDVLPLARIGAGDDRHDGLGVAEVVEHVGHAGLVLDEKARLVLEAQV